jgi:hypothetical protein
MDELQEITETFDSVVSEMAADSNLVPVSSAIIDRVTAGDNDPQFATFVIESGWSKSRRFWGPELFGDVAAEMNRSADGDPIVGYMGHISEADDPYVFPEIQLQWVGAKLLQSGEKAKLAVKAYVLPGTKGRDYLKRGLVKTVSWRGKVAQEKFQKGVRIKQFAIESIDLARPRAAGMSARLVGALTSEMENEEKGNSVKPEEIGALQENELRAHNPGLVTSIEASVRKPLEDRVSEMTTEVEAVKPVRDLIASLRSVLGLGDDVEDATVLQRGVTEIRAAAKKVRESLIDNAVTKIIKGDSDDAVLARRLVVGEMKDREITLTGDETADAKTVSEMVETIIDSEDSLKKIVSEMEDSPTSPPVTGGRREGATNRDDLKPGYKNKRISVRSAA